MAKKVLLQAGKKISKKKKPQVKKLTHKTGTKLYTKTLKPMPTAMTKTKTKRKK